jgi:hypothetical protein
MIRTGRDADVSTPSDQDTVSPSIVKGAPIGFPEPSRYFSRSALERLFNSACDTVIATMNQISFMKCLKIYKGFCKKIQGGFQFFEKIYRGQVFQNKWGVI